MVQLGCHTWFAWSSLSRIEAISLQRQLFRHVNVRIRFSIPSYCPLLMNMLWHTWRFAWSSLECCKIEIIKDIAFVGFTAVSSGFTYTMYKNKQISKVKCPLMWIDMCSVWTTVQSDWWKVCPSTVRHVYDMLLFANSYITSASRVASVSSLKVVLFKFLAINLSKYVKTQVFSFLFIEMKYNQMC